MCQSYTTQRIQRNSVKAIMAPVFDKPPTPPVNGTQNAPAPPQPSSSTGVTLKTSLPEVKKPPVPQNRGLKKVTSEDDTSLVWRMFSIDW